MGAGGGEKGRTPACLGSGGRYPFTKSQPPALHIHSPQWALEGSTSPGTAAEPGNSLEPGPALGHPTPHLGARGRGGGGRQGPAVKVTLTAGRTGTDSGGPGTRRVTTASPSGEPTLPQGLPPTPAPHCWWEMSQAGHLSPRKTSLSCAEWGGPGVLPTRAPSAFPLRGGDASRWSFLQLHPARAPASPPATTMQVQLRREAGVRFFLLFMPFATKLSVSKYEKKNLNGL